MSTRILALSGSLREGSLNTALLQAAAEVAPAGVEVAIHDYADVPLYSEDLDKPDSVVALETAIAEADALLFAVPEYNHSVPGVLKNAVDWASRPAMKSVFRDKPTAVISASKSFVGGARGQQHMKLVLLGMAAEVFPWPELLVGAAHQRFEDGRLVDEPTRRFLTEFMEGLAAWIAEP